MIRRLLFSSGLALAVLCAPVTVLAQPGGNPNNAVGIWGQDTGTGLPCIIAPPGGSATCKLPVPATTPTVATVTCTHTESSIATGGTAQTAIAAGTYKVWLLQNTSAAALTWRTDGSAATATSFSVPAGTTVFWGPGTVPANALSLFGATTAQTYVVETCT